MNDKLTFEECELLTRCHICCKSFEYDDVYTSYHSCSDCGRGTEPLCGEPIPDFISEDELIDRNYFD